MKEGQGAAFTRIAALARKEIYSYSISPFFYGICLFFLIFNAAWLFYYQHFFARNSATLRPYFAAFPVVFILVIPALTMKGWAEERKVGTSELLLTLPFSEWDLVLGKFLALLGALAFILCLTVPLPLSLLPLGDFDGGVILGEYLGAFLLGASAGALGLLLSALFRSQAGAFLGSAVALLVVMLIHQLSVGVELPEAAALIISFFSLSFHFERFSRGLIDFRDAAYFIITTGILLFLNTQVLLFRKWR
jgi:ABC-2 type transport system permease protein